MYRIVLSHEAEKYMERLDRPTRARIFDAINRLPDGDVVRLQARETYRLRVGDYRVVFEKNARMLTIHVIKIAPRGEVYR